MLIGVSTGPAGGRSVIFGGPTPLTVGKADVMVETSKIATRITKIFLA